MFILLCVDQGILQYLCCADDQVRVLHHFAKEVLLFTFSSDRHQGILMAQVRVELLAVMLVHQMNLENMTVHTAHTSARILQSYILFFH